MDANPESNKWNKVDDFGWLRKQQSPNWKATDKFIGKDCDKDKTWLRGCGYDHAITAIEKVNNEEYEYQTADSDGTVLKFKKFASENIAEIIKEMHRLCL